MASDAPEGAGLLGDGGPAPGARGRRWAGAPRAGGAVHGRPGAPRRRESETPARRQPVSQLLLWAGAAQPPIFGCTALPLALLSAAGAGPGAPARQFRVRGFLAQARGLVSPPPPPATRAAPASSTTAAAATDTTSSTTTIAATAAEEPGAAQRRLWLLRNPDGTVSVRVSNGGYLSVTRQGQLGNEAAIGEWESFELIEHGDGAISLKAWTGRYIGAEGDWVGVSSKIGSAERFMMVRKEDGAIMLETSDGRYVSNEAISDEPGRFAILTREATRVDDTEKFQIEMNSDGTVSLKCLHGSYLSVEDSASVVAGSLTVGREQKFKRHQNSDGTVSFSVVRSGRFLTAHRNGTVLAKGRRLGKLQKFQLVEQSGTDRSTSFSFKASDGTLMSVSRIPVNTFYMYRAQGNTSYPWRSVNTGNLAGVIWYLHNEVVPYKPRKFGIERIVRMKVQTASTKALFKNGLNFGVRFAYDSGMCTGAGPINGPSSCRGLYARLGHFVGCNYLGDFPFPMASKGFPSFYDGGTWYSLPKEGACVGIPTGEDNCTYFAEEAGSVDIGDLYDMGSNFSDWYTDPVSREYVEDMDTGIGSDFWKGKTDMEANRKRVRRAFEAFDEKYPDMPSGRDYPDPICDFNCNRFYSSVELEQVGAECRCSASPQARSFFGEVNLTECAFDPLSGLQNVGYYLPTPRQRDPDENAS
ncbi:unnamed protein product [Prorocentrum cordatum]|uniref:Fascin-like domain-containing protein n=1 Tax=Prorocentrum cordatum TaxID=2364126 RepID=A0ABN9T5E4_9DINO|nr:unnamed protein product [Polarella glacialis]